MAIPKKIEKKVYQEANSQCAFCDENNVESLQVHHMLPKANGGGDEFENLILVCASCHTKIHGGTINMTDVFIAKHKLAKKNKMYRQQKKDNSSSSISVGLNSGIITGTINFEASPKSSLKINPPLGSIGSDLEKRNYIKHLIDRYNDFQKSDSTKGKYKYMAIYTAVKKKFKTKWDMVPLELFPDLVSYLQLRIDNTIVGKINKSRGKKSYSSFEEYLSKMYRKQ